MCVRLPATRLCVPPTLVCVCACHTHAQVNERYPKEVEKRQKRLAALSEALSSGVSTEGDLQRLQQQATSLHTQVWGWDGMGESRASARSGEGRRL